MLEEMAPAKLNLTLEVLGNLENSFHRIRSVAQAINLCDVLRFQPGDGTRISCADKYWSAGESLVSRTIQMLREATGCSRGVSIEVEKSIPLLSGLSGDSSDAAATLFGLNRLWGLNITRRDLLEMASRLGSDVAFFLYSGTALLEGRGEIVTPLPACPHLWVVLLLPQIPRKPGKTGRLYGKIGRELHSTGSVTDRMTSYLEQPDKGEMPSLFNVFDGVASAAFPGLERYRQQFIEAGALEIHLAGSGPVLYSLFKDVARAREVHRRLGDNGHAAYLTDTTVGQKTEGIAEY
ncbi:MAG: 4-(cytidine 5'-diphospho)-2-C-methyl-D-erythritol kinase [Dehalococcoidales bacterium]